MTSHFFSFSAFTQFPHTPHTTPHTTTNTTTASTAPAAAATQGFVALSALSLEPRKLGLVLAPFVVLNVIMVGLWRYISWEDPAGEGGCSLRNKNNDTPHYCNSCRKTVRGFDHHCSW